MPRLCIAGFFVAEPSQAAVALISRDGGMPPGGQRRRDTLWLVYKWEGMQPLALYPTAEQQLPVFFWAQGSDGQTRSRFRMLRCRPPLPFAALHEGCSLCFLIHTTACTAIRTSLQKLVATLATADHLP